MPSLRPSPTRPASRRWAASLVLCLCSGSWNAGCRSAAPDTPPRASGAALERIAREHDAMGTRFRIVAYGADRRALERALAQACERIDALERALSDWDETSELRRLDARTDGGPMDAAVEVSEDLARVLGLALEVGRLSEGAFDPTIGPFVRLWRRHARQGSAPAPEALERAARSVGMQHVELDAKARTVRLTARGMRLDLGGIAKGHAAEEALEILRARGFPRALVDAGGDLALGDPPPGARGWRVGLAPFGLQAADETPAADGPRTLLLANVAVATSGDAERFVELDGVRYSHLVDPRTGLGLVTRAAAVVVAPSGAWADALASALCVLGPEAGLALIESLAGVEARVVRGVDGGFEPCDSSGLGRMMAP